MLDRLRSSPVLAVHILLLAVVFVWGTTFALVKSALADTTPLLFNLLRMLLAFVLLALWNRRALRTLTRSDVRYGLIAGCFLGLGYQFQTSGLAHTTASKAAFITGLVVVIVPILSAIPRLRPVDIPRPRWNAFGGAFVAFGGLILLTTRPGESIFTGFGVGEALCLACAIAFAAHLMSLARAASHVDARVLGTVQIGAAAALMLVTLPLGGPLSLHLTGRLFVVLGVTAVLATAAAFTIQSWAQQHLSPTHTALIFTLEPVFAWVTSLLFLHERLGPRELSGAGLILAGILFAELMPATAGHARASNPRDI